MSAPQDLPDWTTSVGGASAVVVNWFVNAANTFDVAQYQSLEVVLGNLDGTTPMVATYQFLDSTGFIVDQGLLSADSVTTEGAWTLPVVAPVFKLISGVGAALIARVTGLPVRLAKRMLSDYSPTRRFSKLVPNGTASLTLTQLPGVNLSLDAQHPDQSSFNGQCLFAFQVSALGGATSWVLRPRMRRASGTPVTEDLLQVTDNAVHQFMGGHPFAFTSWVVVNFGALTADVTATLTIFPAETP